MWLSNKVIALVNVGQVEVIDFKLFLKINSHKDGDCAYVLAGRKLSSEETATVLEQHFSYFNELRAIL
jgi:hypothetical protein